MLDVRGTMLWELPMTKVRLMIACLFSCAAIAAAGQVSAAEAPVCLQSRSIDHTHVVDSKTVLFYMRGGQIWQNDLPAPCTGLNLHGFVVRAGYGEICGGQGVTLLQVQEACMLGKFKPYSAPPAHGTP